VPAAFSDVCVARMVLLLHCARQWTDAMSTLSFTFWENSTRHRPFSKIFLNKLLLYRPTAMLTTLVCWIQGLQRLSIQGLERWEAACGHCIGEPYMLLPLSKLSHLSHLSLDCVPVAASTLATILSSLSMLHSLRLRVGCTTDTRKDAEAFVASFSSSSSSLSDLSICGLAGFQSKSKSSRDSLSQKRSEGQLYARTIAPCLLGKQNLTGLSLSTISVRDVPCVVEHMQCMQNLCKLSLEWQHDSSVTDVRNSEMLAMLLSNACVVRCCTRFCALQGTSHREGGDQFLNFWRQIVCMQNLQHLEVPKMLASNNSALDDNALQLNADTASNPGAAPKCTHLSLGCVGGDLNGLCLSFMPSLALRSFTGTFENLTDFGAASLHAGLRCCRCLETVNIDVTSTHSETFDPLDVLRLIVDNQYSVSAEKVAELQFLKFRFTDLRRDRPVLGTGALDGPLSTLHLIPGLKHLDLQDCVDMNSQYESLRAQSFAASIIGLRGITHLSLPFACTWSPGKPEFTRVCSSLAPMKCLRSLAVSAPRGICQECLPDLAAALQSVASLCTLSLERSVVGEGRRFMIPEDDVEGMFSDPQYVQPLIAVLHALPRFVCLRVNGCVVDLLQ
jgi:hypothetical protein